VSELSDRLGCPAGADHLDLVSCKCSDDVFQPGLVVD